TVQPYRFVSAAQLYVSGDLQLSVANVFNEDSQNYFGTQIELLKSARLQSGALDRAGITLPPKEKNPYVTEVGQPMRTSILALKVTGPEPNLTQRFLQALVEEYLAYKKETRRLTTEDVLVSMNDQLGKREIELKAEQVKWVEFQKTNNVALLEAEAKNAGLYLASLKQQSADLKLDHELLVKGIRPELRARSL